VTHNRTHWLQISGPAWCHCPIERALLPTLHLLHSSWDHSKRTLPAQTMSCSHWQRTSILPNIPRMVKESPKLSSFASLGSNRFCLFLLLGNDNGPLRDTVTLD
jgi:hypothetical protein